MGSLKLSGLLLIGVLGISALIMQFDIAFDNDWSQTDTFFKNVIFRATSAKLPIRRNISLKKGLFFNRFNKIFAKLSGVIVRSGELYKSHNSDVILLESKVLFLERLKTPPPMPVVLPL